MIVSVTERPVFKRCRRKWLIESPNRWGLQLLVPATALSLGTFVHAALGGWIVDASASPKKAFLEAARDERARIQRVYSERNPGLTLPESSLGRLDDGIALGYAMMVNYEQHWREPLPAGFTVVAQEQRILVPVPGTEHTQEWLWDSELGEAKLVKYGETKFHYLSGRLDGIIKDKRDRLYVLEHKTYGLRPREDVLRSTDQFVGYQWMLTQLDLGYPVAGVAYDGLWKRAEIPKTVDRRPGVRADLFCRLRIEHGVDVLQEFQRELAAELLEMANNPPIYKNRTSDGSCFWGCGAEPLCAAISHGEDYHHIIKTEYAPKPQDADLEKQDDA